MCERERVGKKEMKMERERERERGEREGNLCLVADHPKN